MLPRRAHTQSAFALRPRAPFVTAACPFECCTYGPWRFESAVALRAAPRRAARVVGTLPAGTGVRADSGHVRIDTLGVVLVRRGFRDPDSGDAYEAGDTVLVLDYLGEGFSHVWVRGRRRQLSLASVLSRYGPPAAADDTATLREVRPPVSEWWAHVTLPPRVAKPGAWPRRGWILMTAEVDVRGAYSCGGPG
jgi:hypothetical protein